MSDFESYGNNSYSTGSGSLDSIYLKYSFLNEFEEYNLLNAGLKLDNINMLPQSKNKILILNKNNLKSKF